jgi:hypothetical protein
MYQIISDTHIRRLSDGATFQHSPGNRDYERYLKWIAAGNTPTPAPVEEPPTQFELDQRRYQRRAAVQSDLMSWMAADNMSRVRSGAWTVPDLTGLMDDPAMAAAQAYMSTLSYELAAQAIQQATTPLLTPEIKANWVAKLTEHFYLAP